jgi:ABC-type multidrug transport system fused ATPase/permease subunit
MDDIHILSRAFGDLKPYRRQMVGVYVIMFVSIGLALLIPQFIRWIIDRGIREQDLRFLAFSVIGLLALTLVRGILTFFQGRWTEIASQGVAYLAIMTRTRQDSCFRGPCRMWNGSAF